MTISKLGKEYRWMMEKGVCPKCNKRTKFKFLGKVVTGCAAYLCEECGCHLLSPWIETRTKRHENSSDNLPVE